MFGSLVILCGHSTQQVLEGTEIPGGWGEGTEGEREREWERVGGKGGKIGREMREKGGGRDGREREKEEGRWKRKREEGRGERERGEREKRSGGGGERETETEFLPAVPKA